MLAGKPSSCVVRSNACTASPSDPPGARLNETVTAGNCPWRLTTSGVVVSVNLGKDVQRHLAPADGPDIEELQRLRALPKLGHHFQHDTILVQLGKHRGDLPLAERVVEGVVNQSEG